MRLEQFVHNSSVFLTFCLHLSNAIFKMLKAKYGIIETRNRFLESKIMNHETKIDRVDVQLSGIETTLRQYEQEHEDLRHHIDTFSELLLGCQVSFPRQSHKKVI